MKSLGMISWLLMLVLATPVAGRTSAGRAHERYNVDLLDMGHGLPNNFVDDIHQDSYGFIWICTRGGGLVRYDGYGYEYFGSDSRGRLMRSHSCKNVAEDRFHRLWVAFDDYTGILGLNTLKETMPPCATTALESQLARALKQRGLRVYRDTQGNIWMVTQSHIHRIAFDSRGTVVGMAAMPCRVAAPDVAICDIRGDGSVWLGHDSRIELLTVKNGRFHRKDLRAAFAPLGQAYIMTMTRYRGYVWLGTNDGIYIDDADKTRIVQGMEPVSLSQNYVTALCPTSDGRLLIGTLQGLDVYHPLTRTTGHWNTTSPEPQLSSNFVNCLLAANGQIWVGTESGGVNKLTPRLLSLVNYTHQPKTPGSLSPNCVNAMYVQRDGTLWVGTVEGGLNRKAPGSNTFVHYTTANSPLTHNSVSTLAADAGERTLWIGTWGGGICTADLQQGGAIRPLNVGPQSAGSLDFIGALAVDTLNRGLWVGTNTGLFFYDFTERRLTQPLSGRPRITGCIGSLVTRDQQLLVGCLEGMVQIDLRSRRNGRFARYRQSAYKLDDPQSGILEKIQAFCQTRDGTLWLGSNGYGLYRCTRWNGQKRFKAYTTDHGLPCNAVKGIAEDARGRLWITTEHGLAHFDPQTETFDNYTRADGLLSTQFYFNSVLLSPQGVLYLGSCDGLTALMGLSRPAYTQSHLCFTRLLVDNEEVTPGSGYLHENMVTARTLYLHEGIKSFTIEFSALDYGYGHEDVYSCRMKGFDDAWMRLQPGQHSVRYSTLPPGDYVFQVAYGGAPGSRHVQTIGIRVRVAPYFYKTWWFLLAFITIASAAAYALYRRRLRIVRRREAERLYRPIEAAMKESDNPESLQARIQTILANQNRYVESVAKTQEADKQAIARASKSFMDRVMTLIEAHYSDPDFGVEELCERMGMGRSALSKRLNAETGLPTSQFIRNYRLDIARRILLENVGNRNISEIAFKVGFNDPKYFTRCFTRQYGTSPSLYTGK